MSNFLAILKLYEHSLKQNGCTFAYQRKNCKKHGHFKKKVNIKTGETIYEIRIDQDDNDSAKIYTFIHEWAHMYNRHLEKEEAEKLTYSQKEYVAHTIAMYSIKRLNLLKELEGSNLQKKWDIKTYGEMWLKDKQISDRKIAIMNNQITRSINYSEEMYTREFFS